MGEDADWEMDETASDTTVPPAGFQQSPQGGVRRPPQEEFSDLYQDALQWGPLLTLLLVALVTAYLWRQRQQRTPDSGPSNDDIRKIWAEKWKKEQQTKPKATQQAKPGAAEEATEAKKVAKEVPKPATQQDIQEQWIQRHEGSIAEQDEKPQEKPKPKQKSRPKARPGAEEEAARFKAATSVPAVNNSPGPVSEKEIQQCRMERHAESIKCQPSSEVAAAEPEPKPVDGAAGEAEPVAVLLTTPELANTAVTEAPPAGAASGETEPPVEPAEEPMMHKVNKYRVLQEQTVRDWIMYANHDLYCVQVNDRAWLQMVQLLGQVEF